MNAWLPLVAGLVGTIIGGVIAYLNATAQWRRQQRTDRSRYLLSKLEQLCNTVLDVQSMLERMCDDIVARIGAMPAPTQDQASGDPSSLKQMQLFVSLYFPALAPHVKAILSGRDQFAEFAVIGEPGPHLTESERLQLCAKATLANESADAACVAFLEEAARIARRLLHSNDAV